jgi:tetratricopeptide (TPR) repeat protein
MTTQPILEKDIVGERRMFYPDIIKQFSDDYWQAVELMDHEPRKAEKILKKVISACGNGHIDAILHLGFLYNGIGKRIDGNGLINKAHNIALQALPKDFNPDKERIAWGQLDNRPLLRTFHSIGLEYIYEKQFEKAIEKFHFILKVNPGDNQGVRFLLPECFIQLQKHDDFLTLDKSSEDSDSIEYAYARVLVYYKLEQFDKATSELKNARKKHPYVADELSKDKHSFPHEEFAQMPVQPMGIPTGSKQEAFEYWSRTKDIWEKEKGFKEFIKSN